MGCIVIGLPTGVHPDTGQILGVATGEPQPPHVPEPIGPQPDSELMVFVEMLGRAGVPYEIDRDGSGVAVCISPVPDWLVNRPSPALRGNGRADARFCFDSSGTLICVDITGD